ncbi:MAG TPA: methylmalonyl-CoA mutase family protein, partial [Pseudonocardiaceae bacterium]|nr:methylmalonyl-CoA mutase family protein [Pseudonocardiaceae bacterium]
EKGDKKIVGVNTATQSVTDELGILRVSPEVERRQTQVLARRRAQRDQRTVDRALAAMMTVASAGGNLIEPMLDAARVEATLGEICGALKAQWGEYREPARF